MPTSEELLTRIKTRLTNDLKVQAEDIDDTALGFIMSMVQEHIFNNCNIDELPEGLTYHYIDAVCGRYIRTLYLTGKLTGYDFEGAFKSVHLGDTSVELSGLSAEEKLNKLIDGLNSGLDGELECYRKMYW